MSDGKISVTFKNVDGINDITIEPVQIANVKGALQGGNPVAGNEPRVEVKAGMGLGALAEAINKASDKTGIRASVTAESVFEQPIKSGVTSKGFSINGVTIGSVEVKDKDGNGALRAAINSVKDQTGVEASVDSKGRLVLNNRDGRGIQISDGLKGDKLQDFLDSQLTPGTGELGRAGERATDLQAKQTTAVSIQAFVAGATNAAVKQDVDMSNAAAYAAGTNAGSVLVAANTFEVIQAAHKHVDAAINATGYQAGLSAANDLLQGVKATPAFAFSDVGAANITENNARTTVTDALQGDLDALNAATSLDSATEAIDKIKEKLEKYVKDAAGKNGTEAAAQQGLVAHALLQQVNGWEQGITFAKKEAGDNLKGMIGLNETNGTNFGRLSLVSNNGKDIVVEARDGKGADMTKALGYDTNVAEKTVSLRETNATIDKDTADAMGFNSEEWQAGGTGDHQNGYAAGVMTLKGAQAMMNIAESAQKALEAIRSDLGSVQNQLVSTVNNISVTQVNVKSAESNIRDVDFASESATFSKHQILAQSGVYAMSQANAVQQNVMRLLQ
ncbi:hypothetical protein AVBRAN12637_08970 [Campylobacter sp. RM12637]|nr:hypothetical protein [Campylobacter sp. RM12637]